MTKVFSYFYQAIMLGVLVVNAWCRPFECSICYYKELLKYNCSLTLCVVGEGTSAVIKFNLKTILLKDCLWYQLDQNFYLKWPCSVSMPSNYYLSDRSTKSNLWIWNIRTLWIFVISFGTWCSWKTIILLLSKFIRRVNLNLGLFVYIQSVPQKGYMQKNNAISIWNNTNQPFLQRWIINLFAKSLSIYGVISYKNSHSTKAQKEVGHLQNFEKTAYI